MTINATEFKQAMQAWASGVTVVTTNSEMYGLQGMTVSAFSSVSIEPAKILCCLNSNCDTIEGIEASRCFAVNVLRTGQQSISNQFAGGCSQEERFETNSWHIGTTGAPILDDCLMSLDCKLVEKIRVDSHWIVIGEVQAYEIQEGNPLLYYRANYRELTILNNNE